MNLMLKNTFAAVLAAMLVLVMAVACPAAAAGSANAAAPAKKSSAKAKKADKPSAVNGEDYAAPDGTLFTHATLAQFPQEGAPLYRVSADGHEVGLYTDRSHWKGLVHFAQFELSGTRPVEMSIRYKKKIKSFELLPHTLDVSNVRLTPEGEVSFTLNRPNQNITLIVNGEPKKNVLHLFAASVDRDAPDVGAVKGFKKMNDRKLMYFAPGYHNLKKLTGNPRLKVPDGWTVYVAAGAVVYGSMTTSHVGRGTKICGRGMVYTDDTPTQMIFTSNFDRDLEVEGLLFHCHRPQCWQVGVTRGNGVTFNNVKILSTRYASTDGLDVINCSNCTFRNMFIRANDDAVAIKGLQKGLPADCAPNSNLLFDNVQLWNDCNCAFGIGAETHAAAYENITLRNSCVLFSYDDPNHHEDLDERAALTICCLNGTYFRNILYDNIDVYHCERLIAAGFKPDFWFGSLRGNQTTEGEISDVTYRNVRSHASSGSRIANQMHVYGWESPGTPAKFVRRLTFDNVTLDGRKIQSTSDAAFLFGTNVGEIFFK